MNSFIIFEETIIDRSDLWKSMPGYRVGDPCVWDIGAAILFAIFVLYIFKKKQPATDTTRE